MKYLNLKSNFDMQKKRIFFITKVIKKKKYKKKKRFIYLFSKRKSAIYFIKPLSLDLQNIIHFNKNTGLCTQKQLYLRGITGLPINNVFMRYKYFDFDQELNFNKFTKRYNFEIFNDLRKNFAMSQIIKVASQSKKIQTRVYFFVNIAHTFKNKKLTLKNQYRQYSKKIILNLLLVQLRLKSAKSYLIFITNIFKKYLYFLNIKIINLNQNLVKFNRYYLYTLDLFIFNRHKNNYLNYKKTGNNFCFKKKMSLKQKYKQNYYKKKMFYKIFLKQINLCCLKWLRFSLLPFNLFKIFAISINLHTKNFYLCLDTHFMLLKKISFFLKNKYFFRQYIIVLLRQYKIAKKQKKKIINKFFFKFFCKKSLKKKINAGTNFFFNNFVLYNAQYFKKYWWYFLKRKRKFKKHYIKQILNKKKIKIVATCKPYYFNHIVGVKLSCALYCFFSLLLNKQAWLYYYKTFMPNVKFKFVPCQNLYINLKITFFSWFKKQKMSNIYKNKLCYLNYKNKYIYLYFYNYLYFKQVANLIYLNSIHKLYLLNCYFFWNDYQYSSVNLMDNYDVANINFPYVSASARLLTTLRKQRVNLIKNYLNEHFKFSTRLLQGTNLIYDFSINTWNIFTNSVKYKVTFFVQSIQKKNNNLKYLKINMFNFFYFFFKLLGIMLKRVFILKTIYYLHVLKHSKFALYNARILRFHSKFIFDFFFLLYYKYLIVLKLIHLFYRSSF